jgi:hypothetical protein
MASRMALLASRFLLQQATSNVPMDQAVAMGATTRRRNYLCYGFAYCGREPLVLSRASALCPPCLLYETEVRTQRTVRNDSTLVTPLCFLVLLWLLGLCRLLQRMRAGSGPPVPPRKNDLTPILYVHLLPASRASPVSLPHNGRLIRGRTRHGWLMDDTHTKAPARNTSMDPWSVPAHKGTRGWLYPCADASPGSSRPFVARFGLTVSRHLENLPKASSDYFRGELGDEGR